LAEVVELFERNREAAICAQLGNNIHLVRFEPGRIEFHPNDVAPRDLASRTATLLTQWTGTRWVVSISREAGEPTLAEQAEADQKRMQDAAESLPLVQAVKAAFPGASIHKVSPRSGSQRREGEDGTANPDERDNENEDEKD
jgi:DNA polymerase-3 subunit gamma/tau